MDASTFSAAADELLDRTGSVPDIMPTSDREAGQFMLGRMLWHLMVIGDATLTYARGAVSLATFRWLCDHGAAPGCVIGEDGAERPAFDLIDPELALFIAGAALLPRSR